MKTLVVYDSAYGNTAEIAEAMAAAIGTDAKVLKADVVKPSDIQGIDVLIAGSPTYGGRPTKPMQAFLKSLSGNALTSVSVAGFDTRSPAKFVKIFGFAAGKIEKSLVKLGGKSVIKPEGFYVAGTQGPLVANEKERAGEWGKSVISGIS